VWIAAHHSVVSRETVAGADTERQPAAWTGSVEGRDGRHLASQLLAALRHLTIDVFLDFDTLGRVVAHNPTALRQP